MKISIGQQTHGRETVAVTGDYVRSGSIAGALSAFVFAVVHHIFISNIWFSLILMMVAGALCGMCIAWSYALLTETPSLSSWLRYNMLYVALLALLGAVSVIIFEPVTTIATLIEADGPPGELIEQALPVTAAATLFAAILISLLYARTWSHFGAVLLTCVVLVILLGLNVSAIGLVTIPSGSLYLVMELFGLILVLNVVYATIVVALEKRSLQ